MLDGLQVGQSRSECLAFLDEGARPLEAGLSGGNGHAGDDEALLRQLSHEVLEPLALFAEEGRLYVCEL